jgi:exosortase H (IPTLxxWG-CTERM-specific)
MLTIAEAGLTLNLENQRNARAGLGFDHSIQVDETQAKALSEPAPDGTFAGTHRAYEDEIRRGIHARMLASPADFSGVPSMLRFFLIFMSLLIALFALRISAFGEEYITGPFTGLLAYISVWIVTLFDSNVISYGKVIASSVNGFAVEIAPGCDGIEAVIILIAALVAFPSPWKHKFYGVIIGFFCIQALNLVRIISLFYMGQWSQVAFDWFHLYLWQALIVLDALAVWLIWLRYLPKPQRRAAVEPAAV